ncbi:MAG: hypothetical protein IIB19_07295 [Chloroflexi bacterium]|nr:hypothetical protein [Chloroflexota bacterium]
MAKPELEFFDITVLPRENLNNIKGLYERILSRDPESGDYTRFLDTQDPWGDIMIRLKDGTEKWRGRYFCPDWTWCAVALKAGRKHRKGHVDRLSGFVAEFNVFVGTFQTYPALGALGILGAAITAVYILRMLSQAFFGPANERWADLKEMSHLEQAAGALLIVFIVFMGVFPSPFVDRIADSVLRIPGVG